MKKQGTGIREQGSGCWNDFICWVAQVSILRPGIPSRWSRCAGPVVVLLAAAVAVWPLFMRGPSCGHDFDFHLVSWFECLNSWRHGIAYPHWAASANFGAGEPRFIFYPPLTWMLGAALGAVLPWTLDPVTLTYLLLAGTGLATRALARQFLPAGAATLAGCAALFSGYALFTAYERTAFGELAGGIWMPLLLLFALQERNSGGSIWKRALDGSAAPLALVVAGCWLSNLPLGVMACYLLAAVTVVAALLARSWAPVLRAALAAALGLGLTAVYLLPAAWEQRWVNIREAIDDPGERIENSWLFAHHADPALADHDTVLLKVSIIAASMIAVALGCLIIFWLRCALKGHDLSRAANGSTNNWALAPEGCSSEKSQDNLSFSAGTFTAVGGDQTKEAFPQGLKPSFLLAQLAARLKSCPFKTGWWLPLALIPLAVLFLQLPVSLPVWNLLPKLRFLQFPWRWLVVLETPMAIFFAAAVWPRRLWLRAVMVVLCAAFFLEATAFVAKDFYQACDDQDSVPAMVSTFKSGAGFLGADEYAPASADNGQLASGLPAACFVVDPTTVLGVVPGDADPDNPIPVWKVDQHTCEITMNWQLDEPERKRLAFVAPRAGFLILRLRSYPAWKLWLNGRPLASLPQRDDGLIAVPVEQGPVDLNADWTMTPDETIGRWISVLAALPLITLFLLERKLKKSCPPRLS